MRAVLAAALLLVALATPGQAASRAGVVVAREGTPPRTVCVDLEPGTSDGLDLLRRSGLDLEVSASAQGTSVCRIDGDGCDPSDCFCAYPIFWGYWTRAPGGDWTFSDVGASAREVNGGVLDAWVFGHDGGPAPEAELTFEEVCAAGPVRAPARGSPRVPVAAGVLATAVLGAGALLARRRRRSGDLA